MNELIEFIKNNYSAVLSIIAITISLVNLLYLLTNNKKNLQFEIENFTIVDVNRKKFYMFNVNFINKSRLPIAVNQIIFNVEFENYNIIKSPRKITEKETKKNNVTVNHQEVHSAKFPINILGLTSLQQFIVMYGPESIPDEDVTIILCTNRGKVQYNKAIKEFFISPNKFAKDTCEYYD